MSKTAKTILLLLIIAGAIYYFINSDFYINRKPISNDDIVGTWDNYSGDSGRLYLLKDGYVKSNSGFFHGYWKIISSDNKYVQISFDMTDEEYETALEELYVSYMTDEELWENGLLPYEDMKDSVWESYGLPEDDLVLEYIRSEEKMISLDDEWVLKKE